MNLFKRLHVQIYAVFGLFLAVSLVSALWGLNAWRTERYQRFLSVERAKIAALLESSHDEWVRLLLSKSDAPIQARMTRFVRELKLDRLELLSKTGKLYVQEGFVSKSSDARIEEVVSLQNGASSLGTLIATKGVQSPQYTTALLLTGLALLLLIFFTTSWMIRWFIRRQVLFPIEKLIRSLSDQDLSRNLKFEFSRAPSDVQELWNRFEEMRTNLEKYQSRLIEAEREAQYVATASQVAHDIRSPLAALLSLNEDFQLLPEHKRSVIRSAVDRIQDIANHLLDSSRKKGNDSEFAELSLLPAVVEELISEKRFRARMQADLRIEDRTNPDIFDVFVDMGPSSLKRVLSNLLDNALDAIEGKGTISVSSRRSGEKVELVVEDDGRGIPESRIPELMKKGASFDKAGGSGLGLFSVKELVERAGGAVSIESVFGEWTRVTLTLPIHPAPRWFADSLDLSWVNIVVLLDDDPSVHHVWRARYEVGRSELSHVRWAHFYDPEEFKKWFAGQTELRSKFLLLVDQEFANSEIRGTTLISELGLGGQSVLVTSRYEDSTVQKICSGLGTRILPKSLVSVIPFRARFQQESELTSIVVIDDDPLVRQAWKLAAARRKREVVTFASGDEFLAHSDSFSKSTPIYIDLEFGGKRTGIQVAERISRLGFHVLYLATGHKNVDLSDCPWIRGAVAKIPFPN